MKKNIKLFVIMLVIFLNTFSVNAEWVTQYANVRDADYDIIGAVDVGDYVTIYGIDTNYPDRTLISCGNMYGSILTTCISEYSGNSSEGYSSYSKSEYSYHDYSIEVSIDDQYIYLMDNGSVIKSSPCVTGNCGTRDTPCGTYNIYSKSEGACLSGADYNCYVNYWMAINGGIGIHDASWRSDFGGDIYIGNGSHGCINVPYDMAETIYSLCDVGTMVIVY